jgi:hypothetical protein
MTEAEWLASEDPAAMLDFLTSAPGDSAPRHVEYPPGRMPGDRKLRLFACACVRLHVREFPPGDDIILRSFEDGDGWGIVSPRGRCASIEILQRTAREAVQWWCSPNSGPEDEWPKRAALLRDVVGNPFRPVALDPAWLTDDVRALAVAAYEQRGRKWKGRTSDHDEETGWFEDGTLDPARLAVLSDALEEAGCPLEIECPCVESARQNGTRSIACERCWFTYTLPNPLLAHLRSPGPHHRGMWSLDLILGRS